MLWSSTFFSKPERTQTDAAENCRVTKEIYWYTKIAYRCVLKRKFPQGSSSMMTKFKFAKKGKINKNQSLILFFGQFWQLQFWITSRSGHDDHHHSLKRSLLRTQDFQLSKCLSIFPNRKTIGGNNKIQRTWAYQPNRIWLNLNFSVFHVTEESGRKWSPTRAVDIWGRRGRGATGHMSGDQEFFFLLSFLIRVAPPWFAPRYIAGVCRIVRARNSEHASRPSWRACQSISICRRHDTASYLFVSFSGLHLIGLLEWFFYSAYYYHSTAWRIIQHRTLLPEINIEI